FEYHALTRQEARAPGSVPAIHYFDEGQALIIMEYLAPPHIILRRALIDGRQLPNIARDIGLFMARTLFRGSDLHMAAKDRKADLALFADNVELCDITESLEFAFYGPMAFDVGMLLANFWMSFFSQRGHEEEGKRDAMRAYMLGVTVETWSVFRAEFSHLWRTERSGMLYQKSLFEDQGDKLGAEQALDHV
ncbi:MAG: S-methyl-5-thioribose kinase, partial [Mesorhizobium sp.]